MKHVLEKLEKKLKQYKKMLEGNLSGLDPHQKDVPDIEDAADIDSKRGDKMQTDGFRNGINVEEYDYNGEKETIRRAKGAADLSKQAEPDMASPDQPKGLENKRKPVTHDECGRPFAKEDDLDAKIKAKLKAEMDKRKFGEADATKHIIDRDRGEREAQKPKPKPLLQTEQECVKFDSNGQWSIEKSNYGPKGMGQYTPKDNIQRKMKNTGEEFKDAGKNVNAKKYTTSGSSIQAAHEANQAKEQKAKTKASTKIFTEEEKRALEEKYRKEGKI